MKDITRMNIPMPNTMMTGTITASWNTPTALTVSIIPVREPGITIRGTIPGMDTAVSAWVGPIGVGEAVGQSTSDTTILGITLGDIALDTVLITVMATEDCGDTTVITAVGAILITDMATTMPLTTTTLGSYATRRAQIFGIPEA